MVLFLETNPLFIYLCFQINFNWKFCDGCCEVILNLYWTENSDCDKRKDPHKLLLTSQNLLNILQGVFPKTVWWCFLLFSTVLPWRQCLAVANNHLVTCQWYMIVSMAMRLISVCKLQVNTEQIRQGQRAGLDVYKLNFTI